MRMSFCQETLSSHGKAMSALPQYRRASAPPVITVWSSNQEPVVVSRPRRSTVAAMSVLKEWSWEDGSPQLEVGIDLPRRNSQSVTRRRSSNLKIGSANFPFARSSSWKGVAEAKETEEEDAPQDDDDEEDIGLASFVRFLIPDKFGFVSLDSDDLTTLKEEVRDENLLKFVSSKLHQSYFPLCADFGPVDLSIVFRFCRLIRKALNKEGASGRVLIYCIETDPESRANAAFLLASFMLLEGGCTPQDAASFFMEEGAPFPLAPFRDATYAPQDYDITLLDCLEGLARAVSLRWFDMHNFDLERYEYLFDSHNGDISQVCPNLIAFKGPLGPGNRYQVPEEIAFPPAHYISEFLRLGVTAVVRLNEPDAYDAGEFEAAGIRHYDLYFDDCTVPPHGVVDAFLGVCAAHARVAVHCRAGLGRTGTLIALWMMTNHEFTANQAIGWLRIVRPGSVIGPQQQYLADAQAEFCKTPPAALLPAACPTAAGSLPVSSSGWPLSATPPKGASSTGVCGGGGENDAAAAAAAELAEQVQRGLLKKSARSAPVAVPAGGGRVR